MASDAAPVPALIELTGADGDGELAHEFYRSVLSPSFRGDELVGEDELLQTVHDGSCHVLLARDPDGTIIAGAVGDWFPRSRVQLLSYLATRPGIRGRGVGSVLMKAAVESWVQRLDPLLVVGEVEDPRHYQSPDGYDSAYGDVIARLRFYEKHGVRSLPIPYSQPALRSDSARVPHLLLMVFAVGADARISADRVDGAVVERLLVEYFTEVEGEIRPDDAEVSAMLQACRVPGGLPLLLAEDLPEQ
jgi:GNAT superfamily N-acetyltransferase